MAASALTSCQAPGFFTKVSLFLYLSTCKASDDFKSLLSPSHFQQVPAVHVLSWISLNSAQCSKEATERKPRLLNDQNKTAWPCSRSLFPCLRHGPRLEFLKVGRLSLSLSSPCRQHHAWDTAGVHKLPVSGTWTLKFSSIFSCSPTKGKESRKNRQASKCWGGGASHSIWLLCF